MKKILFISLAVMLALSAGLIGCEGEPAVGDPIELTFLIRTEDERQEIGDYGASVLEDLGFTVDRHYGTSGELAPLWLGEPDLGLWHAYTGGWVSTSVERDAGTNFGFFYTTIGMAWMPVPLWAAYTDEGDFYDLCEVLWTNDFTTAGERANLFEDAMWWSMNDSVRIFLLDRTSFSPVQTDTHLAADAYGGIYASWLWALTVHFRDGTGVPIAPTGNTTLRMSTTDLFIDPWNPVGGSNWAYDMFPIRALSDQGFVYDPNTGLPWPHRVADADITWVDGLPMIYDADHETGSPSGRGWLTHGTSVNPIPVPDSAWADWDVSTQNFLTTGAVHGSNTTCLVKTVTRYADDIWTVPLHDGSLMDEADFLLYLIQYFDRAKPTSNYYDPNHVPVYDAFMSQFKGVEYNFSPGGGYALEITTYGDQYYLDAELVVADNQISWFPHDNSGQFAWHTVALGMLAERDGALAFSQAKADTLAVEWTNFIAGPSLAILDGYLDDVRDSTPHADYRFVPYTNVIGPYLTTGDIDLRYNNLDTWYTNKAHFWVSSGPYFLEDVDTLAPIIELGKHTAYPNDGDRWFFTMTPVPTTPYPVNDGGWFDVITIEVDDNAAAVTKLGNDELDVYAFAIADSDLLDICDLDPDIWYYWNAGSFNDLTFNPAGPFFAATGEFNPFAIPEVRQAMNWAINRDYIVSDIMSGMAIPRYGAIGSLSGDGVLYSAVQDAIDLYYAYDFDEADARIEDAMLAIPGVTRDVDGTYRY